MNGERALVGNASDPEQVREAGAKELKGRDREIEELHMLFGQREFRRFYWRMLERSSAFASVFSESPSRTAYNAGQQDFGHWLFEEIKVSKPEALLEMMVEAQKENAVLKNTKEKRNA